MAFNGSGVYALPSTTVTPAIVDNVIDEVGFNTFTADIATALNLCVLNDGQTVKPTIASPIINEILDANQNESLEFSTTASAVNNLKITNAATANRPTISTSGEADIGIDFENSEGEELLILESASSAVNAVTITNAVTGDYPVIKAAGEANIGLDFRDSNNNLFLFLTAIAGVAANRIDITPATAGNPPIVAVTGSDADIDLSLAGKGTGGVTIPQDKLKIGATAVTATAAELNNAASLVQQTVQATTSGTQIDFTSIPSWAKKITISLDGVSVTASCNMLLQLGDSSGINTGPSYRYSNAKALTASIATTASTTASSWLVASPTAASAILCGEISVTNVTGDTWAVSSVLGDALLGTADTTGGVKPLLDTLTQLRLSVSAGAYDLGQVNLIYEG